MEEPSPQGDMDNSYHDNAEVGEEEASHRELDDGEDGSGDMAPLEDERDNDERDVRAHSRSPAVQPASSPDKSPASERPEAREKSPTASAKRKAERVPSASPPRKRSRSPRKRVDGSLSRSPVKRTLSRSPRRKSPSPRSRDRRRSRSPARRHTSSRRDRDRSPRRGSPRRRSPPRRGRSPQRGRHNGIGKPGNNLFVAGFNFITNERDLERKFGKYGRVCDARIVRDGRNGESRGFGFVTLDRDEDADDAIRALDQTEWNGRIILVEKAKTPIR